MSGTQASFERLCELMRSRGITSLRMWPVLTALARTGQWMTLAEIATVSRLPSVVSAWIVVDQLFDRINGEPPLVKRKGAGTSLSPELDSWALSLNGREAMELLEGQLGGAFVLAEDKTISAAVPEGLGGPDGEVIDSTITGAAAELLTEVSRAKALVESVSTAEAIDLDELNASICRVYELAKAQRLLPGGMRGDAE